MTNFISRVVTLNTSQAIDPISDIYTSKGWTVHSTPFYRYDHDVDVAVIPHAYFGDGVVAFTDAVSRISMSPPEFMPYQNGIHAGPAVLEHELMHVRIERSGGIHDERGINDHVAYKLGYTVFLFPSY